MQRGESRRTILNFYQRLYLRCLEKRNGWKDEHVFPGGRKNTDKTFYVIRRSGMKLGLFSLFNTNLARIDYAIQNNMIPVVDMQNFNNAYLEEGEYALVNAWEKFFEQPTEWTLESAYRSKRVYLSNAGIPDVMPNDSMDFFNDLNGQLLYWRDKCKKYIRLKKNIEEYIAAEEGNLFKPDDKVLGVLARGTDYLKLKPSKHPVQPSIDELLKKTKEVLKERECNKIFLATEDKKIATRFFEEFGEICITNAKEYVDYKSGYLSEIVSDKKNERFTRGLDYLTTILLLAKCSCIVAGRTSGTVGAALFSEGWKYSYFFDLGYYD